MHVHTSASIEEFCIGPLSTSVRLAFSPELIAQRALEAGMDFIAITDHDTIDGALELLERRPELASRVIVGEEVTTVSPESGSEIHVAVYGLVPRQHEELQRRRGDLPSLLAYLRDQDLVYVLNHPIWDAKGRTWDAARLHESVRMIRDWFPIIEGRNGSLLPSRNRLARKIAERYERPQIGGSDTHAAQVGYTWTEAPGETPEAFLESIRRGDCRPAGRHVTHAYLLEEADGVLTSFEQPGQRASGLSGVGRFGLEVFAKASHRRLTQLFARMHLGLQRRCVPEEVHTLAMGLVSESVRTDVTRSDAHRALHRAAAAAAAAELESSGSLPAAGALPGADEDLEEADRVLLTI